MFRLRDYGAPFLPGMDREFPCPICTAADVNGHDFPAVEILDPCDIDFDRVFVRDWLDGEFSRRIYVCDTCSGSWEPTGRPAISYAEIRHLWLTDRAGYDDLVMEATSGVY